MGPAPVASPSVTLTRLRPCRSPPPRAASPSGQREHDPGALSNFLLRVTRHNGHLSVLIVTLGRVDTATVCKGLEDNMPNMKAKTKKSKAGPATDDGCGRLCRPKRQGHPVCKDKSPRFRGAGL